MKISAPNLLLSALCFLHSKCFHDHDIIGLTNMIGGAINSKDEQTVLKIFLSTGGHVAELKSNPVS